MQLALSYYNPNRFSCAGFDCGVEDLDAYIIAEAKEAAQLGLSATRVCVDLDTTPVRVVGYVSVSPFSLAVNKMPESLIAQYGSKYDLPAWRIGKLAVTKDYQRNHIGELLLHAAIEDIHRRAVHGAGAIIVIDAKDKSVKEFYKHHDFISMPNTGRRVYLPIQHIDGLEDNAQP